jgi:hypothetical protein
MSTTPAMAMAPIGLSAEERVATSAHRMYDAEIALHTARQTHVDAWVAAAYTRLHEAINEHTLAMADAAPRRAEVQPDHRQDRRKPKAV